MNKILHILLLFPIITFAQYGDNSPVKAFPDAYGAGAESVGGRNNALCIVNTLTWDTALSAPLTNTQGETYYTGGLKAALQKSDVGYIIFNLTGNITLPVGNGSTSGTGTGFNGVNNKTIFGQSAPQGGITITGGTFRFDGQTGDNQDLIFRYFRSRPIKDLDGASVTTDDSYTAGIMFYGGQDIILDHFSASFAHDKAILIANKPVHVTNGPHWTRRITVQKSFSTDSHTGNYAEINDPQTSSPEEYVDMISMIDNVLSGLARTPNMAFDGYGEILNQVIYNSQTKNTRTYHALKLNHIGNYYKRTNNTYSWSGTSTGGTVPVIYSKENIYDGTININGYNSGAINLTGSAAESNEILWIGIGTARDQALPASYFTETKHTPTTTIAFPHVQTSPDDAYTRLITDGDIGAYKYLDDNGDVQTYRDTFDTSQLSIIANNTAYTPKQAGNWVLPTLPSNTRPGAYDTDNDGMSDTWEVAQFGDLTQGYGGDFDGDGYENIEEYMNQVDGITANPPITGVLVRPKGIKVGTTGGGAYLGTTKIKG